MNRSHQICSFLVALIAATLFLRCDKTPTAPAVGTWLQDSSGTVQDIHSVWGSGPADVYAVGGDGTIDHYDGSHWTLQASGTHAYLWSVAGSSDTDVFAVGGGGTIVHYDGSGWQSMSSGTLHNLTSVTVLTHDDVYAAGEQGTVLHFNGSSWQPVNTGIVGFISSIEATRARINPAVKSTVAGVVALTSDGSLYTYFGSQWEQHQSGFFPGANDLWFLSWQDIYFVHADKVIRAGSNDWKVFTSPGPNGFQGISGSSLVNIYAVGKGIIHFDGIVWSTVTDPTTNDLYDVWVESGAGAFAVGKVGTILRYVQ